MDDEIEEMWKEQSWVNRGVNADDLEGLVNGYDIIIIVIGLHEASVTEYLLRNVKPILIPT
jgi:hypothetical protein